jgi:hypothetical protein
MLVLEEKRAGKIKAPNFVKPFFVVKKLIVILTVFKICCLVAYKLRVAQIFVQFLFVGEINKYPFIMVCFMPLTVSQTIKQQG